MTVLGDGPLLHQVVANLLANALVHAPGAPIEVRVHEDGADAVIEVRDEGPGMSETDAARAFERFYRADASRSRHHGGSGLGLAIVDATVRAHGGNDRHQHHARCRHHGAHPSAVGDRRRWRTAAFIP